jgi:hypothetical protein
MNQKRHPFSPLFMLLATLVAGSTASGGASEGRGSELYLYLPAVRSDFGAVEPPPEAVVIVAAGDIVCGSATPPNPCVHQATSDTVLAIGPHAVLGLGDLQYETGDYADFMAYYDPTWGRFKAITHPAAGNHEYQGSASAEGYFDYFNGIGNEDGPAGERSKGYYSFDLGAWHIIALNSNCAAVDGCHGGTPQEQWLKADLAAHPNDCTLAFWHHPRYTSGGPDNGEEYIDFWDALHDYGAEVVLVGHRHNYERYLPQDAWGNLDETGIVEFVVGTGGKNLTGLYQLDDNSAVFNGETFGVLKMTLSADSYSWEFVPSAGGTFTDVGTAECH